MGKIQIFTGEGRGKTPAALGEALMAAALGKQVVIIQFLKGRGLQESLTREGWSRRSSCSGLKSLTATSSR